MLTFMFKGVTFAVRTDASSGNIVFRDEAHWGGPWSNAVKAAANTSLHATFRRLLRQTAEKCLCSK